MIRCGAISKHVVSYIEKLAPQKSWNSESGPVNIFATGVHTEHYNSNKSKAIDAESHKYRSDDRYDSTASSKTLDQCPAVSLLQLKKGAQVMLIRNITRSLVNGTVGIVTRFIQPIAGAHSIESLPVVRFTLADGSVYTRVVARESWSVVLPDGKQLAARIQIPLILAWAITIHKSQGQTIQRLKVDLGGVFESGQVYTALSRAVSVDNLQVVNFDALKVQADDASLKFYMDNNLI